MNIQKLVLLSLLVFGLVPNAINSGMACEYANDPYVARCVSGCSKLQSENKAIKYAPALEALEEDESDEIEHDVSDINNASDESDEDEDMNVYIIEYEK